MLRGSSDVGDGAAGASLAVPQGPISGAEAPSPASFVESICLPALRNAQNYDGGWGFRPGCESRVEPTCWALQALLNPAQPAPATADTAIAGGPPQACEENCRRGFQFLRAAQLPDGSWPATLPTAKTAVAGDPGPAAGQETGCSVTALACWVLLSEKNSRSAVAAGLRWLNQDQPRAAALWQRWLRRLSFAPRTLRQDDSCVGWGWTPGTSSWVEPTAITLIVLNQSPRKLLSPDLLRRRQSAKALLYERMCPGGGWDCGNPLVYGAAGQPLVIPTAWALLALRRHAQRAENRLSLDWLENSLPEVRGPGSLALAQLCLQAYGRPWPAAAPRPQDLHRKHKFLYSVPVTAWVCLAASGNWQWLLGDSTTAPQESFALEMTA
ncbi:MAG: hypothetical protein ABSD88_17360 [Candidatus Korobacteraceae bacterium]|jgi:hypothetical protein